MNKQKTLFITGITGGLGKELLELLLEKTENQLFLLVRPKGSESQETRIKKLLGRIGINGKAANRIQVFGGDVTQPRLGLVEKDWETVTSEADEFYHSAALTNLGATWDEAEKINLQGTLNLIELALEAKRKGRLRRFFYFSTAYVAGSRTPIHAMEDELPENPVFGNYYEATKFQAEKKVREELATHVPTTIFRPSIVVGDSKNGAISEFNVIYPFMRLFAHGLLKKIPSEIDHSFNIVPIDFVINAAFVLSQQTASIGKTFHLVSEDPPTLKMLLEVKEEYGNFPSVDVVPPEEFSIEDLTHEERQVFSTLNPYLGYLDGILTFDTTNARKALKETGVSFPKTDRSFLKKLIDYAITRGYFLNC